MSAAKGSAWNTACPDWKERIKAGRSLVPSLPLNAAQSKKAVAIFNNLRLPDVTDTPRLEDAAGEWFRDVVRALFGAYDPVAGVRHINEVFVLVPKKNSKALALDTLVATPAGFRTIAEIQPGDMVIDSDGHPTCVVCKSEVFTGRICYEIEFSTGERVVCDAEHLWVTDAHLDRARNRGDRKLPRPTVKSTAEIAETLKVTSGGLTINNHRTAICGALELPPAYLPIDPYVLGAWLGDGTTDAAFISSGPEDVEHMLAQFAARGQTATPRRYEGRSATRISLAAGSEDIYRFRTEAVKLGVLCNKHVPPVYLRASREQRLELLRGMMDTDGHISKAGQAVYSTTLPALRDGVVELVNGLGFKASVSEHRATLDGRDCGPYWRVQFWPFAEVPVFTIPRKVARQQPSEATNAPRSRTRQIVACREVPSVPTQCIGVASDTHQFLITRSLLPTHNTTYSAALMLTAVFMSQRPRAEFLLVAPTQEVASLAFSQAVGMIALDPVLRARCHVQDHIKRITYRPTGAFLKIKSFDTRVVTGSKPAGVLLDETHVIAQSHDADRVVGQLRGGLVSQPEGFIVQITTQSERPPSGVFEAELRKARAVRDGRLKAPILPLLYELPEDVEWRNPDNWPLVLPNAGRSIHIPRLVTEYRAAQESGQEELRRWASQHLNVQIGVALMSDSWAGAEYWTARADPSLTLDHLLAVSDIVDVGIDGGGLDDMLGLAVAGRHAETGEWLLWTHAWIHPIALERRKANAGDYLTFQNDGDLTIVDQIGEDVVAVAELVAEVHQSGLLDQIGVDAAGIGAIVDALVEQGIEQDKIITIPQGWRLAGAIKTLERRLAGGTIRHHGARLMTWCAGNAKIEARGNAILVTKQAAGFAKIDPLMASFNAVALLSLNPAGGRSFWEAGARQPV